MTAVAAAAKLLQLCPTLCDPINGSPPGSSVPGILQARVLEWVAISFFNAWKWKVKVKSLSRVRLFATPWTAAYQAPPSMVFSRQEYWSGVPSPSPTMEYYSTTKKNKTMPFAPTWMDLAIVIPSEVSQRKMNVMWYCIHVESEKWHQWIYLQNRNNITGAENKPMVTRGGEGGEGWIGSWRLTYTHYSI